ncbi:hypothetical protein PpBr36_05350 [Pyricularia pennisetigena]|uniref:hypothetical protein n=1 Tax=Pyricularia pennisetigena TaxID=1578925 RepID=UPI001154BD34|nr:hypothetical protein PpBr36_05350 [Pyricularia pennisetigena]TLS27215.1 hypothetical protein PpBr36_05350 [Pyricularia pennisetigena]
MPQRSELISHMKRFSLSLYQPSESQPDGKKRAAPDQEQDAAFKRRRGDDDMLEVLVAPVGAHPVEVTSPSTTTKTTEEAERAIVDGDWTPKTIRSLASPLVDLEGQDIAVVRSREPQAATPVKQNDQVGTGNQSSQGTDTLDYKIKHVRQIGATRGSKVFVARHSRLPGDIVVKVTQYDSFNPQNLPNIMVIRPWDGRMFAFYLEALPRSLERGLNTTFTRQDAHKIIVGLSSALTYLSGLSMCHNDIKPANIVYSPARGAVLVDLGLTTSEPHSHSSGGTPAYMRPEEAFTTPLHGFPGDVWAVGVVMLYVLGCIRLPGGPAVKWGIYKIQDQRTEDRKKMINWLEHICKIRETLSTGDMLERLVHGALERSPSARITAAQMMATLEKEGIIA